MFSVGMNRPGESGFSVEAIVCPYSPDPPIKKLKLLGMITKLKSNSKRA
jgi:hypothetical protein